MFFVDPIPNNLPPDAGKHFDEFAKVAVPILSALVPTAVAALLKWAQDHDRRRRKADLIEQLSKLAKSIADLPELPPSSGDAASRMRAVLNAELEAGIRELALLQTRVVRRSSGVSSIAPGLKSAFLWWKPKGLAAWTLHFAFYLSLAFLAFMTLGFSVENSNKKNTAPAATHAQAAAPAPTSTSDDSTSPGTVIAIYIIFGIPPLIFRHFAVKIHRRQCAESEAAVAIDGAVTQPV